MFLIIFCLYKSTILFAVISLELSDSSESEEETEETDAAKKKDEDAEKQKKEKKKRKRKESQEQPQIDYAHQVELTVLDAVENLEERVASASLQVKVSLF
jgi:sortase (surface protein transpeptidase)